MPPLVLSTSDSEYTNDVSLSDAPAVWMTGDRIRFINSESGRAITTTAGVAAIRMDGADGVVVNEAGGIIRSAIAGGTPLVIQGSAGSDRVENAGTIIGLVALGEGSDTYLNRTGTSEFQTLVDLGGGDDFYYVRATSSISLSANVDGGEGMDRYVIENDGNVDGPQADNFEILDLRGNGFIESFSGLDTIVLDFRGEGRNFNGLRFFNTPDAQVQILAAGNNANVSIYDRSAIGGVTGSAFADSLDLGNDTLVSGTIDLGGGNDYMVVRHSQFENPQQSVFGEEIDGGEGTDTLSIQLQGGDTFDAGNVVNFERMQLSTSQPSSSALVIRNVDDVPELVISQFNSAPVRLESSDLSGGSIKLESSGSLVITADSVVGLVFGLTPFPIDTVVSDDTRSLSIVNHGQILGDVRLYIGDDLLDSSTGTVGGHVLGYAGNDTILTDAGDNWLDGGAGADYLSGGAGSDVLIGGSAGDTLIGGAGTDRMEGGTGNDIYIVDNADDQVVEGSGGGSDTVSASASYALAPGAEVEILSTTNGGGTAAIALTGNEFGQTIIGNAGNNFLYGGGGSGADTLDGRAGDDVIIVDANDSVIEAVGGGNDLVASVSNYVLAAGAEVETLSTTNGGNTASIALTGNEFAQLIIGNSGNNFLYGVGGADILDGGAGDDVIIVDADDTVIEAIGGGNDLIASVSNYVLAAGAEVETLSTTNGGGNATIALTGNEFGQTIIGNAGNNFLYGVGGADILDGGAGDDVIIVDADDQVVEALGGGNDLIASVSNYVLAAGAEVETLSTTNAGNAASIALTGNAFGQTIIGNAGANFLSGGGGADSLQGLGGDDTYIVDADDNVTEAIGGGNDLVAALASYVLGAGAAVETLSTTYAGGGGAINLTGNEFGQAITGNAGSNVIDGKGGNDTLQGGGGADSFAFTTALGAGNVDTIADYNVADDTIQLDDAIFTQIGGLGALNANAFVTGTAAADGDDRIIYNSATGALLYDADGTGATAAVHFATLATGLTLTANDFAVI